MKRNLKSLNDMRTFCLFLAILCKCVEFTSFFQHDAEYNPPKPKNTYRMKEKCKRGINGISKDQQFI